MSRKIIDDGPLFQSIRHIEGWDDTGIDAHLLLALRKDLHKLQQPRLLERDDVQIRPRVLRCLSRQGDEKRRHHVVGEAM